MKPTSDTRCEVAEELRDLVSEHSAVQCDAVAHVLGLKYEVHGCIAAFNREDVTALADLIDPTCHMCPAHAGGFGCDRCYTWFPDMKKKPVYCPACGARVVDEDE